MEFPAFRGYWAGGGGGRSVRRDGAGSNAAVEPIELPAVDPLSVIGDITIRATRRCIR
jgi:hypothetical protein